MQGCEVEGLWFDLVIDTKGWDLKEVTHRSPWTRFESWRSCSLHLICLVQVQYNNIFISQKAYQIYILSDQLLLK